MYITFSILCIMIYLLQCKPTNAHYSSDCNRHMMYVTQILSSQEVEYQYVDLTKDYLFTQ
jgi:hypothetical protein